MKILPILSYLDNQHAHTCNIYNNIKNNLKYNKQLCQYITQIMVSSIFSHTILMVDNEDNSYNYILCITINCDNDKDKNYRGYILTDKQGITNIMLQERLLAKVILKHKVAIFDSTFNYFVVFPNWDKVQPSYDQEIIKKESDIQQLSIQHIPELLDEDYFLLDPSQIYLHKMIFYLT